ncbi:MAG: EAL domain-containing response regulator [Gemmatimonadetes bacterium]|nr:EAL domain-containing response regulator [Gemmatimonadota bacterium]
MTDDFSALRVLIVDDQVHVRKFVRDQLLMFNVTQVEEASSGRAALQTVTAPGAAFDLILCDLRMPEMDGIETIRTMGKLGLQCTVAILSVEDERVIESAGLLATLGGLHIVGEVSKPLTADKLEAVLRRTTEVAAPPPEDAPVISEAEVAEALERKAMEIHYQPRIVMRSGVCVGAEALVRWTHPTHGVIRSDALLALAERSSSQLSTLTQFILREAVAACARWQADGREIGVSVNLSPKVLGQLDLPEFIEQLAREHKVQPARITIEVGETTIGSDLATLIDVAARLRIKGFRLALNDFTGVHSGIEEILKIPFGELKLSRECVDGCSRSDSKRAMVEAGLALARSLKLATVCAGVASRPDWNLLDELGCEVGQGNFIAHAMPEAGLGIWVTQWMMHNQ